MRDFHWKNWKVIVAALALVCTVAGAAFSIVGVPVLIMGENGAFTVKATLASAVAANASANRTIYCMGYTPVSDNLTVPATRAVKAWFGANIEVASGKTLAMNGPFDAGDHTVFSGAGTVTGLKDPRVTWLGAKGDGTTVDTAALIKSMVAGAGGRVRFTPGKIYLHNGTLIRTYSDTIIDGGGAALKLAAGSYSSSAYFLGSSTAITNDNGVPFTENVVIRDLVFDGNRANVTTTASSTAISAYRAKNWTISGVTIKEMPGVVGGGYGVIASNSSDIRLLHSTINRTDRSNVYCWESDLTIDGCTFTGSYYRDCITAGTNTPIQFQKSNLKLSNSKLFTSYSTATHVLRFTGKIDAHLNNLDLSGRIAASGGGTGAAATAVVTDGVVTAVNVNPAGGTNAGKGSGYTTPPEVLIYGGGGRIARATATVLGGAVTGYTVIDGGSGYTSVPEVRIGEGTEGIYIVNSVTYDTAKNIKGSNVRINNSYYGVLMESTGAAGVTPDHTLELSNLEVGLQGEVVHGVKVISTGGRIKLNGGVIKATRVPLYLAYAIDQAVLGTQLIGGTQACTISSVSGGTCQVIGVSITGSTASPYWLSFIGDGEPTIVGVTSGGLMRCTTSATALANSAMEMTGTAKTSIKVSKGSTANRPTLGAYDGTVMHFDTTLAADGKPIWWTGSQWVDATGTVQ